MLDLYFCVYTSKDYKTRERRVEEEQPPVQAVHGHYMSAHGCKLKVMGAMLFARIEKNRGVVGGALHFDG